MKPLLTVLPRVCRRFVFLISLLAVPGGLLLPAHAQAPRRTSLSPARNQPPVPRTGGPAFGFDRIMSITPVTPGNVKVPSQPHDGRMQNRVGGASTASGGTPTNFVVDPGDGGGGGGGGAVLFLSSLVPSSGAAGTSVTLAGTRFTGATGVSFNGTAASTFSVTSSTTATAIVPAGATTGNVTITTPNGTSNGVAFTVTKGVQTITWAAPAAIGYGTALTATQLNATVTGVPGGSATGALTYVPAAGTVLDAGSRTLTVTAAATADYAEATQSVTLTVNQATPTVTATGGSATYNALPRPGSGAATGVGSPAVVLSPVALSYGGTGTTTYGPTATAPTNAGTYAVTATYAGDSNYTSQSSAAAALTITRAPLTPAFTASNKEYDGTTAATILTRSLIGVFGGDAVSLSGGTATFADRNVGPGKTVTATGFTLSGAGAGNYNLASTTATTTADITAAGSTTALTASFTAQSRTYDGTVVATITSRSLSGQVPTDDVSLSGGTATFADKNVGTGKTVTASGFVLVGADAGNYSLSATNLTTPASISPAGLTYTATAASRVYGSANGSLTGTVTGFVGAETAATATSGTASFTSAAGLASPVGGYAINGSGLTAINGNYTFAQAPGNATALSVISRPITITANAGQTKVFGTSDPVAFIYAVGGSGLGGADAFTGALSRVAGEGVGSYAIQSGTLSIANATTSSSTIGNYALTYVPADFSITSAPNPVPVANAGPDQTITLPSSSVVLSGAGTDDGTIAGYAWSRVSGPNTAAFSSLAVASPTVSGLVAGTYVFSLVVTDNLGAPSAADQVEVRVNPAPPGGGFAFYRAINLNGPALTLDGNAWAGSTAPSYSTNGIGFANNAVALRPATDAARTGMIRAAVYRVGSLSVTLTAVPAGSYQVYVYVWEDNVAEVFSLRVNGQTVRSNYNSGPAGTWARLGPYPVTLAAPGSVQLASSGGTANFSGIELWRSGVAPTNPAPVANAGPDQTITLPSSSVVLSGAGTDDGTIAGYAWSRVSGPNTAAFSSLAVASPTVSGLVAGTYVFSLVVTDNLGAPSAADQVEVRVNPAPPGGGFAFYRAINLNGPALTLDGNAWAGSTAPNYSTNGTGFVNNAVALRPATDAARTGMIRAAVYRVGSLHVTLTAVPAGRYQVYVYVWEDNVAEVFSLWVNGQTVRSNYNSGPAGTWARLGPYPVTLAAPGSVQLASSGGTANFSGIELWQQSAAARTALPTTLATVQRASSLPFVTAQVQVYPNPSADGRFYLVLPAALQGEVTYTLMSAVGKRLSAGTFTAPSTSNGMELNLSQPMSELGFCYLHLRGANAQAYLKLLRK